MKYQPGESGTSDALVLHSVDVRAAFWCDTLAEATMECRKFLAQRGIEGEWAVVLGRDGRMRRRYQTDSRGIVKRIGR